MAFAETLKILPVERPRPFPAVWVPLARALVGPSRASTPRLVAGPVAGALLESAGVAGATVGSTIYLPGIPDPANPTDRDVVAHELSHVSVRSATPRFHGGPINAEERRARRVGRAAGAASPAVLRSLAAASRAWSGTTASAATGVPSRRVRPVGAAGAAPSALPRGLAPLGVGGMPVGAALGVPNRDHTSPAVGPTAGGTAEEVIAALQRAPARPEAAGGAVPRDPGRGRGPLPAGVARTPTTTPARSAPGQPPDRAHRAATTIQRSVTEYPASPAADTQAASVAVGPPAATTRPGSAATAALGGPDQFEAILEALQDRVLADLERRGGRFAGEF